MRKVITAFLCLLLAISLVSAQQKRHSKPKPKPDDLDAFLRGEPSSTTLEKRISELEGRIAELSLRSNRYDSVELNTSRNTYRRVDSTTGSFLVRFVRAEPYLNGYKIAIAIGNITTATFNGCDLTVRWGTKQPKGIDEWITWLKTIRAKDEHVTEDLIPGRWTEVELIIVPAKADELAFLELSIKTNEITLRR